MFTRLIVPLDGSKIAEAALPSANLLAHALHSTVLLIHILEKNAPQSIHGEDHLQDAHEAKSYLQTIARKTFSKNVTVEQHIHTGEESDVASSLSAHSGESTRDLIIMCAHPTRRLQTWWSGSIAQQIVSTGHTPILLIPEGKDELSTPVLYKRLLLPLDGDVDHEQVIPLSIDLAKKFHSRIELLSVVPTLATLEGENALTGKLLPSAMRATLEISVEQMQKYLASIMRKIRQNKIDVHTEVVRGDPVHEIHLAADRCCTDLVVLGTHGRIGQAAFWAGSVASKLSTSLDVALLLVPIH